tara:strand:+ start:132 stop:338 length:207 start_codon:yes stop_codon:yes gene_type:complete
MKITSEKFTDMMCKINSISSTAKVSFKAEVWKQKRDDSEFEIEKFNRVSKVEIQFNQDEQNEIVIHVK